MAERKLDLLVIPWIDFRENKHRTADVRLYGRVPRVYEEPLDITGNPASWLAPIGGINAQVTPKHRGQVRLDRKVERHESLEVVVTGSVEPNIAAQQVRVDMTRPDGKVQMEAASTDVAGRFSARFDLGRKDQRESKKKPRTMAPGTYAFQAHILGATRIAPADSNVVFLRAGVKPSEERARVREEYRAIDLEDALRPDRRTVAAPEDVTSEEAESTEPTS